MNERAAERPISAEFKSLGVDDTFSKPETRSFRLLRWLVALPVMAAAAIAVFALPSSMSTTVLGFQVAFLGVAGIVLELTLYRTERRLAHDRETLRSQWQKQRAELVEVATRDELTQLQNRRFYYERLSAELEMAESQKRPLSIVMIDVDDLKAINDEFGHLVGDVVLHSFARILNQSSDERYVTARLGGDEFAVIMPGADRREAELFALRLWQNLSDTPICETEHASIYLGVSIGSSGYPWGGGNVEEITHWADTKLYANKLERKGMKQGRGDRRDDRLAAAVVDVLSTALDVRDKMTHRHARRVARTAAAVARAMNLSNEDVSEIEYAAALHDIGKIGVADSILRKAAPLDPEEWKEMRRHSELGYQILKGIDFFRNAAEIVYAHHEHYDGTGYPRGLIGEEIPLGARVFAVVDAYDAMTSRRPYRDAISRDAALMEIAGHSGAQFDPQVVQAFLMVVRRSPDGFYEETEDDDFGFRVATPEHHANGATAGEHDLVRR
ncbi:MAG TPA: HD domain-containing phosphohydrolase [Dehalococcoidia bacterium]|jgi:diguanylate cyclase (GGDEF)-like protein/putative nucleotidyltransferase with HDIG domain|nr:HD domain-containing phosphohydrolase [Dehalococcoidia bacterium]